MQSGETFESCEFINVHARNLHFGLPMGADIFSEVCDIHAPPESAA